MLVCTVLESIGIQRLIVKLNWLGKLFWFKLMQAGWFTESDVSFFSFYRQ